MEVISQAPSNAFDDPDAYYDFWLDKLDSDNLELRMYAVRQIELHQDRFFLMMKLRNRPNAVEKCKAAATFFWSTQFREGSPQSKVAGPLSAIPLVGRRLSKQPVCEALPEARRVQRPVHQDGHDALPHSSFPRSDSRQMASGAGRGGQGGCCFLVRNHTQGGALRRRARSTSSAAPSSEPHTFRVHASRLCVYQCVPRGSGGCAQSSHVCVAELCGARHTA